MGAISRVHGLTAFTVEGRRSGFTEKEWRKDSRATVTIILNNVNPELFRRIPVADRDNASRMISRLGSLALHFRFLDLPAGLRNRVYGYVLQTDTDVTINPLRLSTSEYPSITRTLRQIREEVLPLSYAHSVFRIEFIHDRDNESNRMPLDRRGGVIQALRLWSQNLSRLHTKALRTICLTLRATPLLSTGEYFTVSVNFSSVTGLHVNFLTPLSFDSRTKLNDHIATVEATRKVLGLQGESIVLALISDPHLWKWGVLHI